MPVRIYREGLASHVYGISYGKDETLDHAAQCQQCKSILPCDFRRYQSLTDFSDELPALIRRTNPRIYDRYKERLEFERMITETPDQIPRKVCGDLLAEKFYAVEPEVRGRLEASRLDLQFYLALIVYLGIAFFVLPRSISNIATRETAETVVMVPSFCLMAYLIFTAYVRYLNCNIYPKLSAALRPLKPGPAEIKLVLRQLSQRKLKVGSAVKPEKMMQWLARKK